MDRDDFLYELAFREIEEGNLDTATWAKAFALSSDDEHAKKLYIQYRVEQNINAPEAYVPDANNTDPEISKEQEPQLVQEPLPESKTSSWLDSFVNIILIVPPVYLAGAWLISLDKGGPNPLGVLTPTMDNGATWYTVLWSFALVYWLLKRSKDKGKHELSPLMRGDYNWGIFALVAVGLGLFFSINQASYKPINDANQWTYSKTDYCKPYYKDIKKTSSGIRLISFLTYERDLEFPIGTADKIVDKTVANTWRKDGILTLRIDIETLGCVSFESMSDAQLTRIIEEEILR